MSETSNHSFPSLSLTPIGLIHSPLKEKFGTPRQPNLVAVEAEIEMLPPFHHEDAVRGLSQFSHIWLIWQFHHLPSKEPSDFKPLVRPPRLGGNDKTGVFASRSMFRPNPLGLSVVALTAICQTDSKTRLKIRGADLVDGTPIYDIKPYLAYSDALPNAQSGFAPVPPASHAVTWHEDALKKLHQCLQSQVLNLQDKDTISNLISLDPRPAYHKSGTKQKTKEVRSYHLRYKTVDVEFCTSVIENNPEIPHNEFTIININTL